MENNYTIEEMHETRDVSEYIYDGSYKPADLAERIKDMANVDFRRGEVSEEKFRDMIKAADDAKKKSADWSLFGSTKKEAIEALQKAVSFQSDFVSDIYESNKNLYSNQRVIARAVSFLYCIGLKNANEVQKVIKDLEECLKNASEHKLSEYAVDELKNLVVQLKMYEDIFNRLDKCEKNIKDCRSEIRKIKEVKKERNEHFFNSVENKKNQKSGESFLDTAFYKLSVGVIAMIAFLLHFYLFLNQML